MHCGSLAVSSRCSSGSWCCSSGTRAGALPGDHVFRASRFSRGNLWFPTQVAVTPAAVVHYTPELFGGREHSMHISHVASVLIDRNLFFSDVLIESSGGTSPVRCHGHRKARRGRDEAAHRAISIGSSFAGTLMPTNVENMISGRRVRKRRTWRRASRRSCSRRCARRSCASSAPRPDESFDARVADADVRADAARRRELHPRARRLRPGRSGSATTSQPRYAFAQPDDRGRPRPARSTSSSGAPPSATRTAPPPSSASAK